MMRGDMITDALRPIRICGLQLDGYSPAAGSEIWTKEVPGEEATILDLAPEAVGKWKVVHIRANLSEVSGPRLSVYVTPKNPAASWAVGKAEERARKALESAGD